MIRTCCAALLLLTICACVPKLELQPPAPAAPRTATEVQASQGRTWDAVIDVFAERNIPIRTMDRSSGFIATEQLRVDATDSLQQWADCGTSRWSNGNTKPKPIGTDQAIYNVLVRGDSSASTVKVTVRWTGQGINCSSKGIW